jgi:hypothetical protein
VSLRAKKSLRGEGAAAKTSTKVKKTEEGQKQKEPWWELLPFS